MTQISPVPPRIPVPEPLVDQQWDALAAGASLHSEAATTTTGYAVGGAASEKHGFDALLVGAAAGAAVVGVGAAAAAAHEKKTTTTTVTTVKVTETHEQKVVEHETSSLSSDQIRVATASELIGREHEGAEILETLETDSVAVSGASKLGYASGVSDVIGMYRAGNRASNMSELEEAAHESSYVVESSEAHVAEGEASFGEEVFAAAGVGAAAGALETRTDSETTTTTTATVEFDGLPIEQVDIPNLATFVPPPPNTHVVVRSYHGIRNDELTLEVGDIVGIECTFDDGWARGQLVSKSHRRGMFPINVLKLNKAGPSQQVAHDSGGGSYFIPKRSSNNSVKGKLDFIITAPERDSSLPPTAEKRISDVPQPVSVLKAKWEGKK
ncbi:hypothetical protein DFJ73DRAFT_830727 [Zopfochytrium polystomum]|nr:hypothetical protein DFJ73DRAFT_830727 [Zopfochytrium polystomum]